MNPDLIRKRTAITERDGVYATIHNKKVMNFCSNDYLGIAQHPSIIEHFIKGAEIYGLGSGASSIVSGYFNAHHEFEEALAAFLGHERAILFSSGYAANISIMRAITTRKDVIASDKLCHASILDGIQLSRAKHLRYRHQDFQHAEELKPTHLVTESIFSMEGDLTPTAPLIHLKQKKIQLIIDIAHSFGMFEAPIADYTITPLGKSLGSMGATISGSSDNIEQILQGARAYHYSTALPPAIAYANLAALKIIQTENWRQEKLNHLIRYFLKEANTREIPLISTDPTPIKTILIKDNQKTMHIKEILLAKGYWIGGIRPPTVPQNTARLRISLTALHNERGITCLLDAIRELI